MALEEYQCYEVYLVTKNLVPDLHIRIVNELEHDYLVECLWRESHCHEKVGNRTSIVSNLYGICKESTLNTEDNIAKLNSNYYNGATERYELHDTIVDEGIRWYVNKQVFEHYYLQCKKHKINMYIKLEKMLENETKN